MGFLRQKEAGRSAGGGQQGGGGDIPSGGGGRLVFDPATGQLVPK